MEARAPRTMDDWLGLRQEGPGRFALPLVPRLCAPSGVLFGGAAIAFFVCAAERMSERRVVSVHAHFMRPATAPETLFVDLDSQSAGRSRTLLSVKARLGDTITATALVSTGDLAAPQPRIVWSAPPSVMRPERCPERSYADRNPDSINGALDVRVALGEPRTSGEPSSDGRCALWARLREHAASGAALIALVADHVPFAARLALGRDVAVVSLDSSLRLFAAAAAEAFDWVLLDVVVTAVEGSLGYGRLVLWSERGSQLAEGSQTFRIL